MTVLSRKPADTSSRYQDDLYSWVQQQVALLRAGRWAELDVENIAEELSDVGAEQYNKLQSALEVLLMHMLKWDHQPERRGRSWRLTIEEQRERALQQLRKNPGLKSRLEEALADGYRLGRIRAAREIGVESGSLPAACPYSWSDVLERPFEYDPEKKPHP